MYFLSLLILLSCTLFSKREAYKLFDPSDKLGSSVITWISWAKANQRCWKIFLHGYTPSKGMENKKMRGGGGDIMG